MKMGSIMVIHSMCQNKMAPPTKCKKQLQHGRCIHENILRAKKESITSEDMRNWEQWPQEEEQEEEEEALFDQDTRDWEEIIASDGEINGGSGDDEGEDVWSEILADTQGLWRAHIQKTRENLTSSTTPAKRPYIHASRYSKWRNKKARVALQKKDSEMFLISFVM